MSTTRPPLRDISTNDIMSSPAPATSRRKSGRAVRAPEKFVPDAPTAHTPSGSAKRKRAGEEAENDASDAEEPEDSEEAIESDEETVVVKKRSSQKSKGKAAQKPSAKRPKVNGATAHGDEDDEAAVTAHTLRLPARPKKSKKAAIQADDEEGLYAEVFATDRSVKDVVGEWLSRHNENAPLAVTELVNFVLKSSGCDIELTEDHINDPDAADATLIDVQAQYQEQNITDYPLIARSKGSHEFRIALVDFWTSLIEALHESEVLYNDVPLTENIYVWISTLTSSASRPFRHTATLAALTMMTALSTIANSQIETSAKLLRQLEAEKKKKTGNKARLADFQKRIALVENRKEFVEAQLNDYYSTVYANRYRDVDARIRLECAEALGAWMAAYPSYFFKEDYLRYMGWMLSDPHAPMRQEIVKQIAKIMKSESNHGNMRHFIERFRPRIIEIAAKDAEPGVRALAVHLADSIREAGFLEPDDIDTLGKLIFDSEPRVRKALVTFFTANVLDLYDAKLEELGGEEALEGFLEIEDEDDKDSIRASWLKYKCLAEILSSYDGEEQDDDPSQLQNVKYLNLTGTESRFTLAAQALFEKLPELRDWEALSGYLLFDHSSQDFGGDAEKALRLAVAPDEREELILLDILSATAKHGMKLLEDAATDKGAKRSGRAEASEEMETAARHLAVIIPRFLKKYGPNPRTAAIVLRLEHVLNLELYQELRQNSTEFAKHLDDITAQFKAHADDSVLKEAGAVFLRAKAVEDLEEIAESKIQSLWDDTIISLRKINAASEISVRGNLSNKVLTELAHILARLAELSSISSPVEYLESEGVKDDALPINILLDIIARGVYEESTDYTRDILEDGAVVSAIRTAAFYFMWKVRALINAIRNEEEIADIDVDHLKEWSDTYTVNVVSAFSSRSTLDPVRVIGAGALLENHTLFYSLRPSSSKKDADDSYVHSLLKDIVPEIQQEITSIFDGLEKQFAKRSRRKLAAPGEDEEPEESEEEPEDDEEEDGTDSDRLVQVLKAEQELCDLTGKIVLAILAGAIDAEGPLKGKLRTRLQRNRHKLGNNFKEVINYLDEPKLGPKKGQKSRAQQAAASKQAAKSKEVVEDDSDEEESGGEEPEEGTVEDLRRRELLNEEPEESANGDAEAEEADDDDIMGD